jgi:hypothetical protein
VLRLYADEQLPGIYVSYLVVFAEGQKSLNIVGKNQFFEPLGFDSALRQSKVS